MYDLRLTVSHVPAQGDMATLEVTVGGLLRDIAEVRPTAEALLEVLQDGTLGRR